MPLAAAITCYGSWARRKAKAQEPKPHDNTTVRLAGPKKVVDKAGNPVWFPAMAEYTKARLAANGNKPLNVKELLVDFARWHGPKNLDRGILRPDPPPIPGQFDLRLVKPTGEVN